MSSLITIEDVSRRDALRRIAGAVFAAGVAGEMSLVDAQHVHGQAAKMKGALSGYQRQELTEHEWETVTRLAELIVPKDSGGGSAVDAGAPEFIDLLTANHSRLADIFHGGLSWLDAEMRVRAGKTFVDSGQDEQTALLDDLVAAEREIASKTRSSGAGPYARFRDYQAWDRQELGAGVRFFDWVRKLSVDAYYTSPIGVQDIGYQGNGAASEYVVPEEAITYVMKRSPFASDDD